MSSPVTFSRSCQLSTINFHNGKILLNLAWEPYYKFLNYPMKFNIQSVLQNCKMLKSHYILSSIKLHRIQLLFLSDCIWFLSFYADLMYTKEMNCKECPFVRKGWFSPSPGDIQKDLTNNTFFFPGWLWEVTWEEVFWKQNMLIEVDRDESQTEGK